MAQDLHQQPARVAAGPRAELEGLVGRLDAGLHPHQVLHLAGEALVEVDEKVDRVRARLRATRAELAEPLLEQRAGGFPLEVRRELGRELRRVVEREMLGPVLDEEVERIDHRHVGDEIDGDVERARGFREDEARDVVAVRVLLPVDEVLLGRDAQAVADDGRPAVGRRPEPDLVRREPDRPVELVERAVVKGDADGHGGEAGRGRGGRGKGEGSLLPSPFPGVMTPNPPSTGPAAARTRAAGPRPTGDGSS